jgi:hypothetical protein
LNLKNLQGKDKDEMSEQISEAKELLKLFKREIESVKNDQQRKSWNEKHKSYEKKLSEYQHTALISGRVSVEMKREIEDQHERNTELLKAASREIEQSGAVATDMISKSTKSMVYRGN